MKERTAAQRKNKATHIGNEEHNGYHGSKNIAFQVEQMWRQAMKLKREKHMCNEEHVGRHHKHRRKCYTPYIQGRHTQKRRGHHHLFGPPSNKLEKTS
ncbi:hypothetical protein SUGI_0561340 [Cryptomeria japonica]|nr:hypothetical protein SUGI_0561340 [Cryptomeria japonica]